MDELSSSEDESSKYGHLGKALPKHEIMANLLSDVGFPKERPLQIRRVVKTRSDTGTQTCRLDTWGNRRSFGPPKGLSHWQGPRKMPPLRGTQEEFEMWNKAWRIIPKPMEDYKPRRPRPGRTQSEENLVYLRRLIKRVLGKT